MRSATAANHRRLPRLILIARRGTSPRLSADCRRHCPRNTTYRGRPRNTAAGVRGLLPRPSAAKPELPPWSCKKNCRGSRRNIAAAIRGLLPGPTPDYCPVDCGTLPRFSTEHRRGYLRNVAAAARALSSPWPTIPPEPTATARGNAVSNSPRQLTRGSPASDKPRECLVRQPAALNSFLARRNPASTRGNAPSHSRGNSIVGQPAEHAGCSIGLQCCIGPSAGVLSSPPRL